MPGNVTMKKQKKTVQDEVQPIFLRILVLKILQNKVQP